MTYGAPDRSCDTGAPTLRPRRWRAAALSIALATATPAIAAPASPTFAVDAVLRADTPGPKVDRRIFGQFVEHLGRGVYDGIWVGEKSSIPNFHGYRLDVLTALRALHVPVIRWPGGCFAEFYNWRDGIGPPAKRPVRINGRWGGVEESNAFGTHEFMSFTELVGAEAYVAADIGSGSPRELSDWIEYMTSASHSALADARGANGREAPWRVPIVGIGNELSNCGGSMRPQYAADEYRRFQTFLRGPAPLMKVASGAYEDEFEWTETMMREAGAKMDGLSLHYYVVPGGDAAKISAVSTSERDWAETIALGDRMDVLLTKHSAIMDRYDPDKRVALVVDEWGPWYRDAEAGSPFTFQNSLRDAILASITFDIFVHHADRVRLAAIAQMINVGSAMAFTNGAQMTLTPTYYTFLLYRPFQDGTALPLEIHSPAYTYGIFSVAGVQGAAVRGTDGHIHVALTNVDPGKGAIVRLRLGDAGATHVTASILSAPSIASVNSFAEPDIVHPRPFTDYSMSRGLLEVRLPPHALKVFTL